MKVLLQRVTSASVQVEGATTAAIGHGLLALVGIAPQDTHSQADWLADKVLGLRIFADDHKPMNASVLDVEGELLVVSQFTLTADTQRGRRPSFTSAASPEHARPIYDHFVQLLAQQAKVQTGIFGADMQIHLVNDGPVTFMLERE